MKIPVVKPTVCATRDNSLPDWAEETKCQKKDEALWFCNECIEIAKSV